MTLDNIDSSEGISVSSEVSEHRAMTENISSIINCKLIFCRIKQMLTQKYYSR